MNLNGRLCILVLLNMDLLLCLGAWMVETMAVLYFVSCFFVIDGVLVLVTW
jgi:hypothetical protein